MSAPTIRGAAIAACYKQCINGGGESRMNREYCGPRRSETRHMAEQAGAHILTVAAIDAARARLARYALTTDWPPLGMVEASDLLDAARAALAEGVRHATA